MAILNQILQLNVLLLENLRKEQTLQVKDQTASFVQFDSN